MDGVTAPLLDSISSLFAGPERLDVRAGLGNGQVDGDDKVHERAARICCELIQVEAGIARLMDALERE